MRKNWNGSGNWMTLCNRPSPGPPFRVYIVIQRNGLVKPFIANLGFTSHPPPLVFLQLNILSPHSGGNSEHPDSGPQNHLGFNGLKQLLNSATKPFLGDRAV